MRFQLEVLNGHFIKRCALVLYRTEVSEGRGRSVCSNRPLCVRPVVINLGVREDMLGVRKKNLSHLINRS